MTDYVRWDADDLVLLCHLQPGAKRSEFVGMHGDRIKIRLHAPPVDGKANEALIKFVAETLKLPKSAVNLKSGHTSRRKVLEVIGAEASTVGDLSSL